MDAERRRQLLLVLLVFVLALTIYRVWPSPTPDPLASPAPTSFRGRGVAAITPGAAPGPKAPVVHLDALGDERPKPSAGSRDLFRFKPAPAPRPAAPIEATLPAVPAAPPAAPVVAPIPFKFIGVLEAPERPGKIAVLSDGRDVFHGREGDIIEGRYRILRIGAESIEMAHLDGRGRQMIRLSGQ
jgi:hypothetical protein